MMNFLEQELSLVNSEGSQESKAMKISNIVNQFESYEEKELDSEFGWIMMNHGQWSKLMC